MKLIKKLWVNIFYWHKNCRKKCVYDKFREKYDKFSFQDIIDNEVNEMKWKTLKLWYSFSFFLLIFLLIFHSISHLHIFIYVKPCREHKIFRNFFIILLLLFLFSNQSSSFIIIRNGYNIMCVHVHMHHPYTIREHVGIGGVLPLTHWRINQ